MRKIKNGIIDGVAATCEDTEFIVHIAIEYCRIKKGYYS